MDLKKSIDNHLKIVEKKFSLSKIKGIDIINITESKQLNLLIIKSLYDQWILNFEKNKLKYFNYEAADVVKASENMMNILSNNISIEFNDFKIIFKQAFEKLIFLTTDPKELIKKDLLSSNLYDEEKLEKKSKYFKYYKELFDILNNKMKENNEISLKASEIINYIDEVTIDINESLVNETCNLVGCDKENLFNITIKKESDYYSFFSLTSKEVDNLILEASSKETFEEAANIILNNINNDYSNKLTSKEIRSLLHKLKKDQSLPA